jgi:hypothetical protein
MALVKIGEIPNDGENSTRSLPKPFSDGTLVSLFSSTLALPDEPVRDGQRSRESASIRRTGADKD